MDESKENTTVEPKVKEAEERLKEMSRKAKERKTTQSRPRSNNNTNYLWYLLGGIGLLGVGYVLFKSREEKRPTYKFIPHRNRSNNKPVREAYGAGPVQSAGNDPPAKEDNKVLSPAKEDVDKCPVSSFELNCF